MQRVRNNGNISNELKFGCGIPQGSCLGPTLFIFYINVVFDNVNNNVKMMMFADDRVLYKSHYLGVVIDEHLNFNAYYRDVKRKVENKIFVLSKVRKYVDNSTSLLIYKQAILP